jgi:hypothetical protein
LRRADQAQQLLSDLKESLSVQEKITRIDKGRCSPAPHIAKNYSEAQNLHAAVDCVGIGEHRAPHACWDQQDARALNMPL